MYCFEDKEPGIVILQNLRKSIIENLHGANQGATAMLSNAQQGDYWLGCHPRISIPQFSC